MKFTGGCHCGAVRFAVEAAPPLLVLLDCNCSICAKTGYLHLIADRSLTFALTFGRSRCAHLLPLRHARREPSVLRDLRREKLLPTALASGRDQRERPLP